MSEEITISYMFRGMKGTMINILTIMQVQKAAYDVGKSRASFV